MGIYTNEMVLDINVIKELSDYEDKFNIGKYWQEFKHQLIGNWSNSIHGLETFSFKKFEKYGLPDLTKSCEHLDLIDEVPRAIIPFL